MRRAAARQVKFELAGTGGENPPRLTGQPNATKAQQRCHKVAMPPDWADNGLQPTNTSRTSHVLNDDIRRMACFQFVSPDQDPV